MPGGTEVGAAYLTLRASADNLAGDIGQARAFILSNMQALGAAAAGAFGRIGGPAVGALAAFNLLSGTMATVAGGALKVAAGLGMVAIGAGQFALSAVGVVAQGLNKVFGGLPGMILGQLGAAASGILGTAGGWFGKIGGAIGGYLAQSFGAAISTISTGVGAVVEGATAIATAGLSLLITALGAAVGLLRDWWNAAAQAEEVAARFDVAIRNVGERVGYTADQFAILTQQTQALGVANRAGVQEAIYSLLKGGNIRGDNLAKTLALAQDLAGTMRGDVAGAANQLARQLENPERGLAMMHREGIMVSETIKDQVKQMMKVGDVAGAQGVIIGLLAERYKGFGEAFSNTFLGQWQKFSGIMDQIKSDLLGSFLPAFKPIVTIFEQLLIMVEENQATIDSWGQRFVGWVTSIAGWIKDQLINAWIFFEIALTSGKGWDAAGAQLRVWISEAQDAFKVLFDYLLDMAGAFMSALGKGIQAGIWEALKLRRTGPDAADVAAKAFKDALVQNMKGVHLGAFGADSADTKALKDKLHGDLAAYNTEFDALKAKYDTLGKTPGKPGEGLTANASDDYGEGKEKKFKFSFAGIEDMSKKLQEAITGGSMESLAKLQITETKKVGDKVADVAAGQKEVVQAIKDNVGGFGK